MTDTLDETLSFLPMNTSEHIVSAKTQYSVLKSEKADPSEVNFFYITVCGTTNDSSDWIRIT